MAGNNQEGPVAAAKCPTSGAVPRVKQQPAEVVRAGSHQFFPRQGGED